MPMLRTIRYYYLKTVRQRDTPEQIAGGMAIGVFLGMVGPPGIQMVIAFGVAALFRCNRVVAAMAVWVTNPLTMPFIYSAQLYLGSFITGITVRDIVPTTQEEFWQFITNIRSHGRAILVMTVGGLIVGTVSGIVSYYATKSAVITYRNKKEERRQTRRLAAQGLLKPVLPSQGHPPPKPPEHKP